MATISLGQTLTGTFNSGTPKFSNGAYYIDYDLPTSLTNFSDITVTFDPGNTASGTNTPGTTTIDLVNATTGAILAENTVYGASGYYAGNVGLIDKTVAAGVSYKVRVSNTSLSNANFSLSLTDQGQATSLVSRGFTNANGIYGYQVGTLNAAGKYFSLGTSSDAVSDVALSPSGLLYGIFPSTGNYSPDKLDIIDPSASRYTNNSSYLLDTSGNSSFQNFKSLAFSTSNQLYAIGTSATGAGGFYQIDVNTKVATLLAGLPVGFNGSGDLVYDAANNRFLASSADTGLSDALWQIPLANPASATKLGSIGFLNVVGLAVENGQITGYAPAASGRSGTDKITLNPSTGAGTFSVNLPNYSDISGAATIVPLTTPVRNDFNGDRKSDILWRNNDRSLALWQMNGSTATPDSIGLVPVGWSIGGTGDFSGDGKADILLSNTSGTVATWEMNGAIVSKTNTLSSTLTSGWSLAGTGDFGGDGKADILLRNTDGRVATWQVNGSTVTNASVIGNAETVWTVAGTADFNGDGKTDILWSKPDGTVALWQMNDSTLVKPTTVNTLTAGWSIAGTADFNGDGKADILLRNTDGSIAEWDMNGANITGTKSLGAPPIDWQITGTGDFNGDGKADILLRNTASGNTATWVSGASGFSGSLTSIQSDASWNIVAPIG